MQSIALLLNIILMESLNSDVLIYIFKLLNFNDQLQLAQASGLMKEIFAKWIWPIKYHSLRIWEINKQFIIGDELNRNRLLFSNMENLNEFLHYYGEQVHVLDVDTPVDMRVFENLNTLKLYISNHFEYTHLNLILTNFKQLQDLHIIASYCDTDNVVSKFIKYDFVQNLLAMENLKKIHINPNASDLCVILEDFLDILQLNKLEILKFGFEIDLKATKSNISKQKNNDMKVLKQLQMMTKADNPMAWISGFDICSDFFHNLDVLDIQMDSAFLISNNIMQAIVVNCPKLRKLTIKKPYYTAITVLALPPNLKEFHLEECYGLTYGNLQQILSHEGLIEFTSIYTQYEPDMVGEFLITSTLATLDIDGLDMYEYRESMFPENSALRYLSLYSHDVDVTKPNIVQIPLSKCQHLESIHMRCRQLDFDILQQLKNLKKLTTIIVLPHQWQYLCNILKHQTLKKLTLHIFWSEGIDRSSSFINPPITSTVPTTTVDSVKVFFYNSSQNELDFWFELFTKNNQMTLAVYPDDLTDDILKSIINHQRFPQSLKNIEICGFVVDCNKLRNAFESTLETFSYIIEDYEDDFKTRKCPIVLNKNRK
ncbi:uncharacterized protein LOC142234945 [Haematobia irritans]|uniref:uncharacterized protein LOC142234945 n=1 Tax=Haematobia irritans TaxID=7368 RepID=UPI003F507AA4